MEEEGAFISGRTDAERAKGKEEKKGKERVNPSFFFGRKTHTGVKLSEGWICAAARGEFFSKARTI